ncbi:cAMP-independent regulatory protein pac2 OS=Schizosaccharomyces pombe (strain 972 / ATCC 24843) GN=pac2 PE=2 SV=1 [Rhizoctonia solani AG-1 IB]|uniref:cAMP-independent regulatory protein pac2 n=1 Tax=Thanatephorus cucumeris (strain AG1-IB / isolate 7/3/14) TaxID=1108050 RepID=A0A0B7FX10_THACB|nr:cAMP-independent regulatory protein pac2 OS=Schizosaccharomyces pombe (strain 972 / ATCC 24843) GN=pac2 PE=2 SV=1 [Rhizoctonia solani AG-1 IB]
MPVPTLKDVTVNSVNSALIIFYAVSLGMLPKVEQRLNVDERESLSAGDVYVWEERDLFSDNGESIERWTDGIKWGSSRVRNEFLFYYERDYNPQEPQSIQDNRLIKQTFSVFFYPSGNPHDRPRKWHMVAYYSQATVDGLLKVENIPQIARLRVPEGMFQPARAKRGHARNGDPASPTMIALARHRVSPVPIPFHSGSIGVSRPHSSPRAPYSHASSSSGTLGFSQVVDLHGYLGTQSLTSEPTERPPPLRRALTFTGENIQTRGPPETGISTGGSSPLEGGTRENSWPLPHISSSYPPSGEITDPRRILPFPAISRAVGVPRISTDDKALSALQTRFMK